MNQAKKNAVYFSHFLRFLVLIGTGYPIGFLLKFRFASMIYQMLVLLLYFGIAALVNYLMKGRSLRIRTIISFTAIALVWLAVVLMNQAMVGS